MTLTPEERAKAQETAKIQAQTTAMTFLKGYLKIMGCAVVGAIVLMLGLCSLLFHH